MPDPDQQQPPPPTVVHSVSVKLPEFWPDYPLIWFSQVEAQFALKKITVSLTKFHYIVSALPQKVASGVIDILQALPQTTHMSSSKPTWSSPTLYPSITVQSSS